MAGLASGRAVQSRCVTLYPCLCKLYLGWPQMKLANLSISSGYTAHRAQIRKSVVIIHAWLRGSQ